MVSRREFLKNLSSASAVGALTLRSIHAASSRKIRIGLLAPSHCALPMVHAHVTGAFKEQEIDIEVIYFADIAEVAAAMIAQEIDAGQLITSLFFMVSLGAGQFSAKPTPLVTAQIGGINGGVLTVGKESAIHTPKDLAGKVIGIHSPLMIHTFLAKRLLKNYGIRENEITFKKINMVDLIQALDRKEIDAFINPEPIPTMARIKNVGRDLITTKNIWFKHPCCVFAMRKNFFDSDTTLAEKVYTASIRSGLLLNDVKSRTAELIRVHEKSPQYNKANLEALKQAFTPGRSDFEPFTYRSQAITVLKMMQGNGLIPADSPIERIAQEAFLDTVSARLIVAAGGQAPGKAMRTEKILNEIIVQ